MNIAESLELRRQSVSLGKSEKSFSYDLELLEKMVLCPSPSKNTEGVMKVQRMIADELRDLGFSVKWIPSTLNPAHYLLHAFKKGTGDDEITFVGHADTVLAPNAHFQYKVDLENNRIYGSGVADDKGGVIVALRGIREFLKDKIEHRYSLNFISSPNEEVGSIGFHHYYKEVGQRSLFVFGFEPSLSDGNIISSRNGNAWYKVHVKGKSAHAGRFGEESINAGHEISRIISSLYQLNDIKNKTKVNVGTISGGTGHFNVVCGEATALIDMRFPSLPAQEKMHKTFESLVNNPENACYETGNLPVVSYEIEDNCPPLPYSDSSKKVAELFKKFILGHEKRAIEDVHTGGAADVNYFAAENLVIDGLGPVGGGLHTVHEYVEFSSLLTRSNTLRDVLNDINMEDCHEY